MAIVSNSSLFSASIEVKVDREVHEEMIYMVLMSDIRTKVCFNAQLELGHGHWVGSGRVTGQVLFT